MYRCLEAGQEDGVKKKKSAVLNIPEQKENCAEGEKLVLCITLIHRTI